MFHLSLRRLEVFVAVAEAGGFSAAAEYLGISQPSVSEHMQALERAMGQTLVERRRGRAAQLTPEGHLLLTRARKLLQEANELTQQTRQERTRRHQRVVVSTQRLMAHAVLPRVLSAFTKAHEGVELEIHSGSLEDVWASLRSGSSDIGYFMANETPADIPSRVVGAERFVFVAAPQHPLAKRKRIASDELEQQPFLRGPVGSVLGEQIDRILAGIGIAQSRIAMRTTEIDMLMRFAAAGAGIYLAPVTSAQPAIAAGTLVKLNVVAPVPTLQIRQAFSLRRQPSAKAQLFADFAAQNWPQS